MERVLNLAVYYLLPLIELSKSSFGDAGDINLKTRELVITDKSNFINAYLSTENYIVVKVRDFNKVPASTIASHNYFSDIEVKENGEGVTLILFRVDAPYLDDLAKFREGKYSRMRSIAIDKIVMFNDWDNKVDKIHNPLYGVLYRSPNLRLKLELDLQVELPKDAEVKAVPDEENFLDLSRIYEEVSTIKNIE